MSEVRSVSCTSCAAPLELKGGHNVRSLVCGYCGAVMDAHEGYQAVAKFQRIERPFTPFMIGRTGIIQEVRFTVIGLIGYEMVEDGELYSWVSSQLFSATHGYAWITYNDGHVVFSRRVRELPEPAQVKHFKRKRRITFRSDEYRLFEQYTARVAFAEGELTWIARQGDNVSVTEAINPPHLFEYEQSGDELEFGLGQYLSHEDVAQAFDLKESLPRASGIHPCQPFTPSQFVKSLSKVGQIFCCVSAAAFVVWAIVGAGQTMASKRISDPLQGNTQLAFTVNDPDQLVEVAIEAPLDNSWIFVEGRVEDGDEPILAIGRELGYYYGSEGGESWTEGSKTASVAFKVPAAGNYALELEAESEDSRIRWLDVEVRQGVMPLRYLIALLLIAAASALSLPITKFGFEKRRWGDDDDD